jgi:hypothetical protein
MKIRVFLLFFVMFLLFQVDFIAFSNPKTGKIFVTPYPFLNLTGWIDRSMRGHPVLMILDPLRHGIAR